MDKFHARHDDMIVLEERETGHTVGVKVKLPPPGRDVDEIMLEFHDLYKNFRVVRPNTKTTGRDRFGNVNRRPLPDPE